MEPIKRNMWNRQGAIVGEEDRNFLGPRTPAIMAPGGTNAGRTLEGLQAEKVVCSE